MFKNIISNYGKPDCIVASSVFTHLENPNKFVQDARDTLKTDGVLIIEIEYFLNMLENMQFERFYFDRPYYYTLISLNKMFLKHEMQITDVKLIKPHGGSLRIYVKNINQKSTISENVIKLLKREEDLISKKFILEKFGKFKNEINFLKII